MNNEQKDLQSGYQAGDRMAYLIEDNYRLLQVLSRFGISLGFGDKTVEEVCQMNHVDTTTFLAVVNFIHSGYTQVAEDFDNLSIISLINYLKQSHIYFLDFLLPRIRRDLRAALPKDEDRISSLILHQLDVYIAELTRHMKYEDDHLFPYVENLLKGIIDDHFTLTTFSRRHHSVDDELHELKQILIKYIPQSASRNELNAVLYDIYGCEDELDAHCKAEDYIFVPAVYNLEERVKNDRR